jgi:tetratricopeptide (TPR) repeat protein
MTTLTIVLASLLLRPDAALGSPPEDEPFVIVVDDVKIRDAATGRPLGTQMRGTVIWRKHGEKAFHNYEWRTERFSLVPTAIMPRSAAAKYFDDRLRIKPNAADYADRGSIHLSQDRNAEALADFDRALELEPNLYRARVHRAECLYIQACKAGVEERQKLLKRSLDDAEKCVALKPNEFQSYDTRFRPLSLLDSVRALKDAEKALELHPDHSAVLNNGAKVLIDLGRRDEAFANLNRAIELDPEYSDAYTNRGIIYHNARRFDEAIDDATQAIKFNPLNISAWNNRGTGYMETRRWEKALAEFSEVIRLTPNSSDGYFGRANVYFSRGHEMDEEDYGEKGLPVPAGDRRSTDSYRAALADCDAALKVNPNDFKCFNTKGNALKKLGKPKEAIEVFDLAMDAIRRESLAAKYTVVDEQKKQHPIWEAVETAMSFADKPTTFNNEIHRIALSHPHRATIAAIMGNRADAWRMLLLDPEKPDRSARSKMLADLTRAITFDPNNPEYFRVRGYYNLEFERWEQAISDLSRAIALRPDYAVAIRGRIIAAMKLSNFKLAWDDAHRLEELGSPIDSPSLEELKRVSGREK